MHKTKETRKIKKIPQPCILVQMVQPVYWAGGGGEVGVKGHAFNVIGLRFQEFIITKLLLIGVYNIIFNYQIPEKK